MIPFDFDYYKPETLEEAIRLFNNLNSMGKQPMYYAGGTEFISMARANNVYTEAIIDIKGIPECNVHSLENNILTIGSAVTLTNIAETNFFPLLSLTVQRIADHTIQDKIALGGNLAGTIIYKEAILPLLVSDSHIIVAGINGERSVPLKDIFDEKIHIAKNELIVQIIIQENFLSLPHSHVKRTKNEKIDYPLITVVALKKDYNINIAFSGLYDYPFRSTKVEKVLNNSLISKDERIKDIIKNMPNKILDDINGSSEYRKFMLHTILYEVLATFEEVN